MKKIIKIPLIIILVLAGLSAAGAIALWIISSSGEGHSRDYFPPNHTLRIEVDSVSELMDNLSEWEGAAVFLEGPEMEDAYRSYLEWKNNPLRESRTINRILSLKANILFDANFQPLIIIDAGWRSPLIKLYLRLESLFDISPMTITPLSSERANYMKIELPPKGDSGREIKSLFLYQKGNLLIISPAEVFLRETVAGAPYSGGPLLDYTFETRPDLKIHLNTTTLMDLFGEDFPLLALVREKIPFHRETLLALNIGEAQIDLQGYIPIGTEDEALIRYLRTDPGQLRVSRILPRSTNILSGYRYGDMESFLLLFNSFLPPEKQIRLEDYRGITKTLLGITPREMLTDWIGEEAGVFTLEGYSSNPVLFVEIRDQDSLGNLFEALRKSLFVKARDNLLMDNTRITLLDLPAPLKTLVEAFTGPLQTPYIINKEGYLFLSSNPETLAHLSNLMKERDKLSTSESFRNIAGRLPDRSPLFFYYDLNTAMPRFLMGDSSLTKLFRLYEKGHLYISYHQDEIRFQFHGEKAAMGGTSLFPGFPLDTGEDIFSPVLLGDIEGSRLPEFAYLNRGGELIISGFLGARLSRTVMPDRTSLLEMTSRGVLTFGERGFLTVPPGGISLDGMGEPVGWNWTFDPVPFREGYLIFNRGDSSLHLISPGSDIPLGIPFAKSIISAPALYGGRYMAVYPKDLFGSYYLLDRNGAPLPGWPRTAGSLSLKGPRFLGGKDDLRVMFLTQKGTLDIRDREGEGPLPKDLEGPFSAAPTGIRSGDESLIAAVNQKGLVTVMSAEGTPVWEEKIRLPDSEDTALLAYDLENDGREELFLHSAGNQIYGWTAEGQPLAGFPVKGHYLPVFADLDNNGTVEMITGGTDRKIYAYTVRKGGN